MQTQKPNKFTAPTLREYERLKQQARRRSEQGITIPACVNPQRRAECEADIFRWLTTYFPETFTNPFSEDGRAIVLEIMARASEGGDKAIAAPRGEGKTSIAERVILFLVLTSKLRFPLIVAATGPDAARILDNIRHEVERNDTLWEDYPEVCEPVRALEGTPQRAARQSIDGVPTRIQWSDKATVFPTVEGSRCSGAILMTRGLDAAMRGLRHGNMRPDFVLIDDPETRESARSEYQIGQREQTIERDIAGLAGQGKKMGRLMLCTLQNRTCLAAKYTDPKQKPSWGGKRYSLLKAFPERADLWEEYVRMVHVGGETGNDPDGREALKFYQDNRAAMDAGAIPSNPTRYIASPMSDGSPTEISALQHCYNIIARIDLGAFRTEYQNDPPEDEGPETSGIKASLVESRVNELPQRMIPPNTICLTAGVDVGKYRCYWTVTAWQPGAIGFVVDYGWGEVLGTATEDENRVAIEHAILSALLALRDEFITDPYTKEGGEIVPLDLVLVDSGTYTDGVYQFIRQTGATVYVPSKGFADGRGSSPFNLGKAANDRRVGNHWFVHKQPNGIWLYGFDADYWKHFVHERFLTPTYDDKGEMRQGTLSMWKPTANHNHMRFARSIVAEEWTEEFIKGKGWKRQWVKRNKENHWLDSTVLASVAADMRGVTVMSKTHPKDRTPRQRRAIALNSGARRPDGRRWM